MIFKIGALVFFVQIGRQFFSNHEMSYGRNASKFVIETEF